MKITKTVPVTIVTLDSNEGKCGNTCAFRFLNECGRYGLIYYGNRRPECIKEFGNEGDRK